MASLEFAILFTHQDLWPEASVGSHNLLPHHLVSLFRARFWVLAEIHPVDTACHGGCPYHRPSPLVHYIQGGSECKTQTMLYPLESPPLRTPAPGAFSFPSIFASDFLSSQVCCVNLWGLTARQIHPSLQHWACGETWPSLWPCHSSSASLTRRDVLALASQRLLGA